MNALTLTLKPGNANRIDLAPLLPERLAGLSLRQIAAIELVCGRSRAGAGELFEIGEGDAARIVIRNADGRLDRIGAGMGSGRIEVEGDAGLYLGIGMAGGEIEVSGNAGPWCASGMRRGLLRVRGDAGDFLAAALPGEPRGMAGGIVLVGGSAGDRAGDRMRRGLLLIDGDAGAYCAARMSAGTIAVWGRVGEGLGSQMNRGTVLLRTAPARLAPTFNDCGVHPLGFLRLMVRSWRALPSRFAALAPDAIAVRRLVGDRGNDGKGEILVWEQAGGAG
jgi:formylmethanofuran dehydrogenase subunit C